MTPDRPLVIVGDVGGDPHVEAVAKHLPAAQVAIIDADSLGQRLAWLAPEATAVRAQDGGLIEIGPGQTGRGWLRRLAPPGWDRGVEIGSHRAAVVSSRFAVLAALLRDPALTWLTAVDDLFAAESKIVQYRAAMAAGVRVPRSAICLDTSGLRDRLGDRFVLKPIGPGNYSEDGAERVVHVRAHSVDDLADADLAEAPFLAQELIDSRAHLRVVTVQDRAWVAELDGRGLPIDWREARSAHHSFRQSSAWPDVEKAALTVARTLHVGFSSQDWIIDGDEPAFLDLNPGGQWLFLPQTLGQQVARAIADWFTGP